MFYLIAFFLLLFFIIFFNVQFQDVFEDLDSDVEEDLDVDMAIEKYKKCGGKILGDKEAKAVDPKAKGAEAAEESPENTYTSGQLFRYKAQQELKILKNMQEKINEVIN